MKFTDEHGREYETVYRDSNGADFIMPIQLKEKTNAEIATEVYQNNDTAVGLIDNYKRLLDAVDAKIAKAMGRE